MKNIGKRVVCLLLVLSLMLGLGVTAFAANDKTVDEAIANTAAYIYKTVANPQVGSIGGEWAVLGLARSGYEVPDSYYQDYYETVESYVKACNGNLHEKKYTEYSRLIVALSSIGKDARKVANYDLTKALGDYDKTIWQGLNGPIWALIALDSANYPMPQNPEAKTQATRDMYVQRILECQLPDGGWSLFGGTAAASSGDGVSDPDITGMALQALSNYQNRADVKKATDEALACLSKMQDEHAGYASWGTTNSESVVQVIVALCSLGISLDDPRFVKGGKTLTDNLLTFYKPGSGFLHTADGDGSNQMATEQGFYGLVAIARAQSKKPTLYRMTDPLKIPEKTGGIAKGQGLAGKHADVKPVAISAPGTTYTDIVFSPNITAIEALAARQIINGKNGVFAPDDSMTRAEFATIVVKALGLSPKASNVFTDVKSNDWFAGAVGTAHTYGIITGKTATTFDPRGTISRQEAAAMVARAAKLCGMDTDVSDATVRDMLAQFSDYTKTSVWARAALAFCYQENILAQSDLTIQPFVAITRAQVAQMMFNLLGSANLL